VSLLFLFLLIFKQVTAVDEAISFRYILLEAEQVTSASDMRQ
jgi:hypothetical protein